jgi:transposase InsO family protein
MRSKEISDKKLRGKYSTDFKLEAVRLVKAGQAISVTPRVLGIPKANVSNWVRESAKGSAQFQDTLRDWSMISSMSRKGNCWDNAPTESFWSRLKAGSVQGHKFQTRAEAINAIMSWIAFYNHRRLHSSLGYLSPMQYEQRWDAA